MLTLTPINPYKARSTGNLEIKGIATTPISCITRTWNQTTGRPVRCVRRAHFLVSKTSPHFGYGRGRLQGKFRFTGLSNTLILTCAIHAMGYIEQYRDRLQERLRNDNGFYTLQSRTPRTKKMLITRWTNELNKINDLFALVHREMKRNKDIAADLLES